MFFYKEIINQIIERLKLNTNVSNLSFNQTTINSLSSELSFSISASGNLTETVTVSSSNDLFIFSDESFELVGGETIQPIEVTFIPDSIGDKTGSIYLSSSGGDTVQIPLSGIGMPEPLNLITSVENIFFPPVFVNSSSIQTFTVTADEQNTETVTIVNDSDQFTFSPSSFVLTGGITNQIVTASFNPTSIGVKTGNLILTSTSGSTVVIEIGAVCLNPPLKLTASITSASFPDTFLSSSSSASFALSAGGEGVELVTISDNTNQFNFSPSSFFLTGGGTPQTIDVQFIPTSSGSKSGMLTLSSSGGGLANVALYGKCTLPPLYITSSVESILFSDTAVNTIKRFVVNITAGGSGSTTVRLRDNSNQFSFSPSSFNLIGSRTTPVPVTVSFYPRSLGTKTGILTLSSSQGQIKQIQMTGTCANVAKLSLSTTRLTFPNTPTNATSSLIFTISSAGTVNETVTITDTSNFYSFNPSTFALTGNNPSVNITASFAPNAVALFTGSMTAIASKGSTRTLTMTGSGIFPAAALTSSISGFNFSNIPTNTSSSQTFIVSAGGVVNETVVLTDNSSVFSFSPSTFTLSGTNPATNVTATYSPVSPVTSSGTLIVSASRGNILNIPFTGSSFYIPLILTSSVDNINFSNTIISNSSSLSFSVSAGGNSNTIETVALTSNNPRFTFSPSTLSLAGNSSSSIVTVTFIPTQQTAETGILNLSSSGGNIAQIPLSGTGIFSNLLLTSSVNQIAFGNVGIGITNSQIFTVSAGGSAIETVTINSSNNQFTFSPSTFSLTGSGPVRTITASFTPSLITSSFATASISSSGGDIKTLILSGTGIDQSVALLLKGDGPNNSINIIDSSNNNFTVFVSGNAKISTTKFKYGTSSIAFDGSDDYISSTNTKFKLSGSYTVEFWINPNSYGVPTHGAGIFFNGTLSSNANRVQLAVTPTGAISANGFGTGVTQIWGILTSAATLPLNTWTHIALSSTGTTVRLFVNGILAGSSATSLISTLPDTFYIGFHRSGSALRYFNGHIDDFRLTQGVATYTTNFTPPGPL